MESVTKARRKLGEGSVKSFNKLRRSQGKEYVNNKKQLVGPKSKPTLEYSCKCKFHCKEVPHIQKVKLFDEFYALQDNTKQNSFLMGLLNLCPVRRRRHGNYDDPVESRRQGTIYYTLPDGKGNVKQVCKNTFLHVFAITGRKIETLVKAKKFGEVVFVEKRGNKTKNRKFSRQDEDIVCEHISTFPKDESHYGRSKSSLQYLSQDLNVHRLYLAFKATHPNSKITYRFYYNTFKNKFPNLRFHHPRSDTCQTCDLLHMQSKSNPTDSEVKTKLEMHHRKAKRALEKLKEDHQSSQLPLSELSTISVDLQQVLSLPFLTHSEMFYLRQLSCYNFGIHLGDTNKGLMFLWHEGVSGRGGNEIASCIWKAVTSGLTRKSKLTIWSDNCGGQNKNKFMLFLSIFMVAKGYFQEVNQKFLVSGHSFLSCDRDFAQIEKRKRVEKCEVPFDLVRLIATATPHNPFVVTMMQPQDFFDFKSAATSTLNTTKLQISKVQWIQISAENPGQVKSRNTLNEMEAWKTVNVFKKLINVQTLQTMDVPQLECQSRISVEKKKNLEAVIPFLKEENKDFYKNLL